MNRLLRNHIYTSRHGLAKGLKRKGGLAFLPSFVPRAAVTLKEEEFIKGLDLSGQTVYDIGGDQGIYTLFFARQVGERGHVVTFEPNPASHRRIVENVSLNDFRHVDVRRVGVGDKRDKLTFVFPSHDPGRGTADASLGARIIEEKNASIIEIDVSTLDEEIAAHGLPEPDFAKIDVEGLELSVLRGMEATLRRRRPKLFIEIHGADQQSKSENIKQVVNYLSGHGYHIRHVESGQTITAANAEAAKQGHIYCT